MTLEKPNRNKQNNNDNEENHLTKTIGDLRVCVYVESVRHEFLSIIIKAKKSFWCLVFLFCNDESLLLKCLGPPLNDDDDDVGGGEGGKCQKKYITWI